MLWNTKKTKNSLASLIRRTLELEQKIIMGKKLGHCLFSGPFSFLCQINDLNLSIFVQKRNNFRLKPYLIFSVLLSTFKKLQISAIFITFFYQGFEFLHVQIPLNYYTAVFKEPFYGPTARLSDFTFRLVTSNLYIALTLLHKKVGKNFFTKFF